MTQKNGFVEVAKLSDVPPGKAIAVRVQSRSIALFNHSNRIYATDNQCPHMGYPLIRGQARNGVLQCDWHGWSYAMDGGGCFTGGCDDLDTFPVQIDDDRILVKVAGVQSKRVGAHYLLLKEGLLKQDRWVLSKAVAIMLAQGVSERETLNLLVQHLGKHIASDEGPVGGFRLQRLINGTNVASRMKADDRLIPFMNAAGACAGRAGDRPERQPLPDPISWDRLVDWLEMFSNDANWEAVEKCLVSARALEEHADDIVPLLFTHALNPHHLSVLRNLTHVSNIAELLDDFGWTVAEQLVCNLGAKLIGRFRGAPQGILREAIERLQVLQPTLDRIGVEPDSRTKDFDSDAFAEGLLSGELIQTFDAVTNAIEQGVHVLQLVDLMVVLTADRLARTPVSFDPGWWNISNEMELASKVRNAYKYAGYRNAVQALYFAAYQFFSDRWLSVPHRKFSEIGFGPGAKDLPADPAEARKKIVGQIESILLPEVTASVNAYFRAGFDAHELLDDIALSLLKHDSGENLLATLDIVYQELDQCASHPFINLLVVGIARFTTHVRRQDDNESATRTAKRFARRETAVDLY